MSTKPSFTVAEAQKKLEHYCTYQERCHLEVQAKLTTLGMIPMAQEQIISHLVANNYLNESRFAQSFARGKFRVKKWGTERIVRALQQRQISPYNIKLGLREIESEAYLETLHILAAKFWNKHAAKSILVRKKKVHDALKYRGWESQLIWECLNNLEKNAHP